MFIIIFEANVNMVDPEHTKLRPRTICVYNFEDETFHGSSIGRLSVYVHKEIEYVHEHSLENIINCVIILKIKWRMRKWVHIIGLYRQWMGSAPSCNINEKNRHKNLLRFQEMLKIF